MEPGNRPIPNTLRLHRQTLGYTQRYVASLLNLHDAVPISLWEKGATFPTALNLIKLSIIYRTYPNVLYDEVFYAFREEIREKELTQFKNL
jgi:transcriptional regulator with XRE-family HTH domain